MSRKIPTLEDHGLWDDVKRTIKPLHAKQPNTKNKSGKMLASIILPKPIRLQGYDVHPFARPLHTMRQSAPPLSSFDRRTAQRLGRGQLEPEARLDLHGEGVETARMKLHHFLANQHQQGTRLVLIITGKGASPYARHTLHGTTHFHTPEREGRLRREVPLWLHEESFRQHVIGFQPSHPKHGGGGAFYVRLRRPFGHPSDLGRERDY